MIDSGIIISTWQNFIDAWDADRGRRLRDPRDGPDDGPGGGPGGYFGPGVPGGGPGGPGGGPEEVIQAGILELVQAEFHEEKRTKLLRRTRGST